MSGSDVSFDLISNGTRAYNLTDGIYFLFVQNELGCSDTLSFDLSSGNIGAIQVADQTLTVSRSTAEINVLANAAISVADANVEIISTDYPSLVQYLGEGIFQVAAPTQ